MQLQMPTSGDCCDHLCLDRRCGSIGRGDLYQLYRLVEHPPPLIFILPSLTRVWALALRIPARTLSDDASGKA
jgi:hypothetical protein